MNHAAAGPLQGVKVIELGGMGPGPYAGMTLADMGAEVIRIERPGGLGVFPGDSRLDVLNRGKKSLALDLKHPAATEAVLTMVAGSDILIEGHRPGVAERLGLGPEHCHGRNPALVYGRMTGWGQEGPLALTAGHDINYIALTGALHAIGPADGAPQVPLNLVGDFGGGGAYLVMGVLAALFEAQRTGEGRVVDAAIVDGASHLLASVHGMVNTGTWKDARGRNMLDGGAPYYAVYETADGRHMAVGAIEPKFYAELLRGLELADIALEDQDDRSTWDSTRESIAGAFMRKTQADWTAHFEGSDACVAPILSLVEAASHPHMRARGSVDLTDEFLQPAPAPRFSGTTASLGPRPPAPGQDTRAVLTGWHLNADALLAAGAAVQYEGN